MSNNKGYTKKTEIKSFVEAEEIELATKIANALVNEESNAYIVHLTKKLDALKTARLRKLL
jgi:hypothetical protein